MTSSGITVWTYLMQSPPLNDVLGTRHAGRRWDGGDDWRMNIQHTFLDSSLLVQIFYSATVLAFISLLGYNSGFFHSGRVLYIFLESLILDTLFPLTNYLIMIFFGRLISLTKLSFLWSLPVPSYKIGASVDLSYLLFGSSSTMLLWRFTFCPLSDLLCHSFKCGRVS